MVALKDLAKEGIVAGYLLGKSLSGGGTLTEINTKLAGTWTSPNLTGANIDSTFIINLQEIFENAVGFNPNVEQGINFCIKEQYVGSDGVYELFYGIDWGNHWVYRNYLGSETILSGVSMGANDNFEVTKNSLYTPIYRTFDNPCTLHIYNVLELRDEGVSRTFYPLITGYYVITIDFYYPEAIFV